MEPLNKLRLSAMEKSPRYRMIKSSITRFIVPLMIVSVITLSLFFERPKSAPQVHNTTQLHMGTLVTISTWRVPIQQETNAVKLAFAEIARIETLMNHHHPDSEISQINMVSRGTDITISEELGTLLQGGLEVWQHSSGAFAMDMQPLTRLWGFSSQKLVSKPPSESDLNQWLQNYPRRGNIRLQKTANQGFHLRMASEASGLDLGGIAKGYAIDQAIEVLQREGIHDAMVNAGGDLRVMGDKDGQPWRIGLQHPRQKDQVIALSNLSGDRAMVTSGDYERVFFHEDVRYHHILDPATGRPSHSGLSSVSVQTSSATLADALSTAIFVLGAEKGLSLLKRFPGSEVLMITESGKRTSSPGFIGEWLAKP